MHTLVVTRVSQKTAAEAGETVKAGLEVSRHPDDSEGVAATRVALALASSWLRLLVLEHLKDKTVIRGLTKDDENLASRVITEPHMTMSHNDQVKALIIINELLLAYGGATFEVVIVRR